MEIAKNGQEKEPTQKAPNGLTVFETGETRTVDFILKDSTRQSFAYIHYLTAWLGKDKEAEKTERYIKIFFATHLITIRGFCLDEIYNHLLDFSLKTLKVHDERYLDMVKEDQAFVTDIKVTWKKEQEQN